MASWTSRLPTSSARSAPPCASSARVPRRVLARARARPLSGGVRRGADRGRLARGADPGGVRRRGARARRRRASSSRRSTRPGCNSGACHAQMYTMGTILRHGSDEQKQRYLPSIAAGELRLQAFGVTEPTAGSDTTRIQTAATAVGRRLRRERPEDLDVARPPLRPHAAARAHDAARGGREEDRAGSRRSSST